MLKTLLLLSSLLFILVTPDISLALRCGNDLASIGDLKHEVLLACGDPDMREVIGYIDQERIGDRIRVMKLEEWIIEEGGHFYSLVFEGNHLVTIESAGRKR